MDGTNIASTDAKPRLAYNGRPVVPVDYTLRDRRELDDMRAKDPEASAYAAIVKSLRFSDTLAPVFTSVDEVYALPARFAPIVLQWYRAILDHNNPPLEEGPDPVPLP